MMLDRCWEFDGSLNADGYGRVWDPASKKRQLTHRLAYEVLVGPIENQLDHLCRNRACYNPRHLEDVTTQENTRRGAVFITHCPQGHEYSDENTYRRPDGRRKCRSCNRIREMERRNAA